jgi:hypothetical protein
MKYLLTFLFLFLACSSFSQDSQKTDGSSPPIFSKFNYTILGKNVLMFDQNMNMKEIQTVIDTVFTWQSARRAEFTTRRFALLFRPGTYDLDVRVDYYMQVLGLGESPGDVIINGAVRSNTTHGNNVLTNFWRAVENLTIIPSEGSTMVWGVSQAAPLRRIHVKGNLQLFDKGYASGGFLADSKIDGVVTSGPQQQWLTRNTEWGKWEGGNWNMMFIGVPQAPVEEWPEKPFTKITATPIIREKPYLSYDKKGLNIKVLPVKKNYAGPGWTQGEKAERTIRLNKIYIADPEKDNSYTINAALNKGKNLLFTPGRYFLNESLKINMPGTVVMGIGLATLIPENGNPVIETADVGGIIVCGLTIDAGPENSNQLFIVGKPGSSINHEANPVFLYDLFFRVGGPAEGKATSCMVINSNNVIVDHIWLWRADHGNGVGWDRNKAANGLIVNGDNVVIYGLFNEHFQEYQTIWNGNEGKVYFYQSEMPYDPPTAIAWRHDGINGYASYKVADHVKSHEAWGIGIYNVFYDAPVIVDQAIEAPPALESSFHHMVIYWLNGNKESEVRSIINGKGGKINNTTRKAVM